ncbi:MAG: ATP-binding protein [Treponema sp.]|nr:ATP-binding protein [Treponema sp.]MCL2250434.1 ATP-binding protein [Treponema sp.]
MKILYVFLVTFLVLSCGNPSTQKTNEPLPYASFRDIPGITYEEKNEIETLRVSLEMQNRSFIYGMTQSNETFINTSGEIGGFSLRFSDYLSDLFGISFTLKIYEIEDLLEGLNNGEIDFTGEIHFNEENKALYYLTDPIIQRIISDDLPPVFISVSLATINPELKPIISAVQKIINNDGRRYITKLYNLGLQDYRKNSFLTSLTDEEKNFLLNHKEIPFAAEYYRYPITFYNKYEKQWQGIFFDVLAEMESFTGLQFKLINNEKTEWHEILTMLETGHAHMVSELIPSQERLGRFLWAKTPIMSDNFALLSKNETPNIGINEVNNVKVILPKSTAYADMFKYWFPEHKNYIEIDDHDLAFKALSKDEAEMIMFSVAHLQAITNYMEYAGYKANLVFDYHLNSFIGINVNENILCSIIDKALALIDVQDISEHWVNTTFDYRGKLAREQRPWLIYSSILLLCVILLLTILIIRNTNVRKNLEEMVNDRTEKLHKYQNDLEEALENVRAANNSKSIFLANMSHEIRTPMNSILGFSELAYDSEASPRTKDYLKKIKTNAEWLLQIINDILDISKIESGRMDLEIIPFDMHELFTSCRTLVMPKAVEKGIMLHFYAEPSIGRKPLGDPTRLRQVFVNLLTNAIKFANTGMVKLLSDIVNMDDKSITIHFEVKDSGIGMTAEQIAKIFDPFTQAETGTTRKYGGTGLGLAITKNIVEKMGGKLSVESTPGIGSKFSFDLTFQTVSISEEEKHEKRLLLTEIEKPSFQGEVLLCEDNTMNQIVFTEHLARVGINTVVAENGRIGVNYVKDRIRKGEKPFDLIFMDIHMPILDGLDATKEILDLKIPTPIIAITANIMTDDMDVYSKSGMHGCLSKPFTSQELWRCLLNYFEPIDTSIYNNEKTDESPDLEFLLSLKQLFIKNNSIKYDEIVKALDSENIKDAYRIAHSLKSNSGQIGLISLQKAATEVENHLKDNINLVTVEDLNSLKKELNDALLLLTVQLAQNPSKEAIYTVQDWMDIQTACDLLKNLKNMLRLGNTESLNLINGLRKIPANETIVAQLKSKLIQQIEDFEFESALITLNELIKNLEEISSDLNDKKNNGTNNN